MAKRVYTPKVQPIAVQIHIQKAIVAQCEFALEEAQKTAQHSVQHRTGTFGEPLSEARIAELQSIVERRVREVAEAQQRLADLEAQAES